MMKKTIKQRILLFALEATAGFVCASAHAQTPAINIVTPAPVGSGYAAPYTFGYEFIPNSNLYATALGALNFVGTYTYNPVPTTGLNYNTNVALYDISQHQLAAVLVIPTSTLVSNFRYVTIPQTLLLAGQHYVVSASVNLEHLFSNDPTKVIPTAGPTGSSIGFYTTDSAITVITSRHAVVSGAELINPIPSAFPTYYGGRGGSMNTGSSTDLELNLEANLLFTPAPSPEPSPLFTLGLGFVVLGAWGKRRQNALVRSGFFA